MGYKGRPIRKIIGGGGAGEVRKKYSRKAKFRKWRKNSLINPTKKFMLTPKKYSYKEFDNEKKFLRLENFPTPPPPLP